MNDVVTNTPDIGSNPFVNQFFVVKTRVHFEGKELLPDGNLILPKETYSEGEPFTKLFRGAAIRDELLNLTPVAKDIWRWFEYSIESGDDFIRFNRKLFMAKTGYTRQSVHSGLKLLTGDFICQSRVKDVYFFNPRLIFFGSRPNKYPNHRKYI